MPYPLLFLIGFLIAAENQLELVIQQHNNTDALPKGKEKHLRNRVGWQTCYFLEDHINANVHKSFV